MPSGNALRLRVADIEARNSGHAVLDLSGHRRRHRCTMSGLEPLDAGLVGSGRNSNA
jgi:hypothetical protein